MIKKLLLILCIALLVSYICYSETKPRGFDSPFADEMYTAEELDGIFRELIEAGYRSYARFAAVLALPAVLLFSCILRHPAARLRFRHAESIKCCPGGQASLYAEVTNSESIPGGEIFELRNEKGKVISEQFFSPEKKSGTFTFDIPEDLSGSHQLRIYKCGENKALSGAIPLLIG